MSRRHQGHFRNKHPSDTVVDQAVMEAVAAEMTHKKMACKTAFSIAERLSVSPATIGIAIDLQEGSIVACQLGLFGHGKTDAELNSGIVCNDTLETAIKASLTQGRLSCATAWQIADAAQTRRLDISQVCDALGIKICDCQLGAF